MWAKLSRIFRYRGRRSAESYSAQARWVEFEFEGITLKLLDCRASALSRLSFSDDRRIAERFLQLRSDDGSRLIGQHPQDGRVFTADYLFPIGAELPNGPLFLARQMEDKFDVYHHDGALFFTRSWTGDLQIKAEISVEEDGIRIGQVECGKEHFVDDDYCLQVLEYLLKSHCLNMVSPHPLSERLRGVSDEDLVHISFNVFGRRGWYGCFESTLGIYNEDRYRFSS